MTRGKAMVAVVVLLVLSVGFADVQAFVLGGRIARNQQSNTKALCAFQNDLRVRARSTRAFLVTHPRGIPGIPAETLRLGLRNEQRTLDALSPLQC